jgi:putative oxidoreductase
MLDLRRKLTLNSHSNMSTPPFISLQSSLTILRIVTPLFFIAHAVVRIINDTIPQFANFLGTRGFPQPLAVVWAITVIELVAGALMIVGASVRCMAAALASIALGGIVLIHAKLGWFVGEHGTGGSEYSVCLLLCLLVIAAADSERSKVASGW